MILSEKITVKYVGLLFLLAFFVVFIKTAWIGDDVGFTFRSILNFLNGYGPQFNIDERVQAFTHPLWFFLLSFTTLITQNLFSAAFISSIACSVLVLWILLTNKSASIYGLVLAGTALIFSRAFIDYSTSGLENPLTNLLLIVAILQASKIETGKNNSRLITFFLLLSLIYLSRPDAIILLFPLALYLIYAHREYLMQVSIALGIGLIPVILWSVFSLFYYGSLAPNTAYAKLNTGIPLDQLFFQGILYYIDSLGADPITLPVIIIGIFLGIQSKNNSRLVAFGIIAYLLYILYIGGDFMSGRFFSAPVLISAYIISNIKYSKLVFGALLTLLLILGFPNLKHTLLSDASYKEAEPTNTGIANERGVYYQEFGLLNISRRQFESREWQKALKQNGAPEVMCSGAVHTVLYAYPDTHFIVDCALADPLLSRLPTIPDRNWRVGHYWRALPEGYKESVATEQNQIKDPAIKEFYGIIKTIVSGSLWDIERLKLILKFNFTSQYDPFNNFLRSGIAFNQDKFSYFILKNSGFSNKEDWGRWSDANNAKLITLELLKSLPKKFNLIINAKAFSQNIGLPTIIKIGSIQKEIILDQDLKEYSIPFELSGKTTKIEIIPPRPVSPREVDSSNSDTRRLGVGIASIVFQF